MWEWCFKFFNFVYGFFTAIFSALRFDVANFGEMFLIQHFCGMRFFPFFMFFCGNILYFS